MGKYIKSKNNQTWKKKYRKVGQVQQNKMVIRRGERKVGWEQKKVGWKQAKQDRKKKENRIETFIKSKTNQVWKRRYTEDGQMQQKHMQHN